MKKTSILILSALFLISASAYADEEEVQSERKMRPALLVIDIQNEYLPYMAQIDRDRAPRMINAAIQLFRESDLPVIRVYHTDPRHGPKPGSKAFKFPSSINIKSDDPMIVKNYPNAFKNTDLEKMLKDMKCNTLFLCGLSAVGCVLATYHGAMDRDFDVFMINDALLSQNSNHTNYIEEILDAVSYKTLAFMLGHR